MLVRIPTSLRQEYVGREPKRRKMLDRLFSRGIERRGDDYVVRYEDDTGTHEHAFASKREAKQFRTTLGLGKEETPPAHDALRDDGTRPTAVP